MIISAPLWNISAHFVSRWPIHSFPGKCLVRGRLPVLTVIRASFLFSSGLAGDYDRCQAPAKVETNYRWRHNVSHQYVSLSLSVCLSPLTFSLDPGQFKWIYGYTYCSVIVIDTETNIWTSLSISMWKIWLISGLTLVNWCHHLF